ncbi:MAG: hypothetical protein L6Q29_04085 [Candidatus Pacebacteria bacterium]|nr:hypothetical protein [Candidatus Paceibacterota bacterium]NUQ42672.1 hypothetical protein [Calditrichaceae bacterium]
MSLQRPWVEQIKEKYDIRYIPSEEDIFKLINSNHILWTTRCCETKLCETGLPIEMYDSYITRFFFRFVTERKLPFAILSDKYGLHFYDERLSYYNTHPSSLSSNEKINLGTKISQKAKNREFDTIIFYNNSPLLSKPYFEMLCNSGLEVLFTTRLLS